MKKTILLIIISLLSLNFAFSQDTAADTSTSEGIKLALIGFDNMDEGDEHDYLSSLISAVIREDLSHTNGIVMLDRSSMNRVLEEQKMQISGLFEDRDAVEAGKLLGSDYLAGGSFIVMDTEVLVDATLIDVETGRVISFSSRGNSEDIIHLAAEKIARELTGTRQVFRTASSGRPIIKATLMPPGMLKLFSPLIDARIYIDDEFYGYTPGSAVIPIEVELKPGKHSVRTDLGRDFGVIIEPEIEFVKWEQEFVIESGKTVVLEDATRHFNSGLYDLQKVLSESESFYIPGAEPFNGQYDFSFTDREGNAVEGSLTVFFTPTETGGLNAQIMLKYDYDRKVWDFECPPGEELEFEETIGLIDLSIELETRYINRTAANWSIWRNDVYQGLHREENY